MVNGTSKTMELKRIDNISDVPIFHFPVHQNDIWWLRMVSASRYSLNSLQVWVNLQVGVMGVLKVFT